MRCYRTTPHAGQPAELWILHEHLAEDETFRGLVVDCALFFERYRLASAPHIIAASDERFLVVAPPWVKLSSLAQYAAARGGIPVELVLAIVRDLAADFATLPADVAIRSLAPSALAITTAGRPRLLDGTLARFEQRTTTTRPGVIKGTLAFLSPELARGLAYDARSDVFALGSIAYELLCGRRAFAGRNDIDVVRAVISAARPALDQVRSGFPPAVVDLVEAMQESRPEDRISFREVQRAIETSLGGLVWQPERLWDEIASLVPEAAEAAIVYGI